jgi:hypothetical protein
VLVYDAVHVSALAVDGMRDGFEVEQVPACAIDAAALGDVIDAVVVRNGADPEFPDEPVDVLAWTLRTAPARLTAPELFPAFRQPDGDVTIGKFGASPDVATGIGVGDASPHELLIEAVTILEGSLHMDIIAL